MKQSNVLLRCIALVFAVATFISLGGCGEDEEIPAETTMVTNSDVAETGTLDEKTVIDKKEYYADNSLDVTTMYLTVRSGSEADNANHTWTELNSYSTYYYDENGIEPYMVEGMLQVGDETGPLPNEFGYTATSPNALVSVRGKTTSRAAQKSYKIKINKGKGKWEDQRTVILNKHIYDTTRFRNKLTYDIMSQYEELLGSKTTFVHLYVKDLTASGDGNGFVDYGLYTQVEQMNTRYLENHGFDSNGQLYKASMFEFQIYDALKLKTDAAYDLDAFEEVIEVKGNDDHTKLLEMVDAVNDYATPIEDVIDTYFDEENYFSWLAFQLIIGNTDITSQNFYLYSPLNGNKWYFIAWDNDGAFNYQSRIKSYSELGYNYTDGVSNLWGATLHRRVLRSDTLRAKLMQKVEYYYSELNTEKVRNMITTYADAVYPYVFRMPDIEFAPLTEATYYPYIAAMQNEVSLNYEMIKESLKHPAPFYANDPQMIGGKLIYAWDESYDFGGEALTYTVQVSTDYYFKNIVFTDSTTITQAESNMLADGKYYMRILATNESGYTQTMQYTYDDKDGLKHFGVSEFYIEKGEIWGSLNG